MGQTNTQRGNWVYKALLVVATLIWGLSFVVMKDAITSIGAFTILGIRFFISGIILALIFRKRLRACFDRRHLLAGLVVGVLLLVAFWFQTIGLSFTTPGKNAFLTAVYVILVPFLWWIIERRRPSIYNFIAAILSVVGVGFVSLSSIEGVNVGDLLTLVCALVFGIHIVYVAKFTAKEPSGKSGPHEPSRNSGPHMQSGSPELAERGESGKTAEPSSTSDDRRSPKLFGCDAYVLTTYQFLFGGVIALVIGLAIEPFPPSSAFTLEFIGELAYLTFFATCAALLIQNVALAHVPPTQTSIFLSLESVFGVMFSVLFYGEVLTLRLILGFALIFLAIVVSETFPLKQSASVTGLSSSPGEQASPTSSTETQGASKE